MNPTDLLQRKDVLAAVSDLPTLTPEVKTALLATIAGMRGLKTSAASTASKAKARRNKVALSPEQWRQFRKKATGLCYIPDDPGGNINLIPLTHMKAMLLGLFPFLQPAAVTYALRQLGSTQLVDMFTQEKGVSNSVGYRRSTKTSITWIPRSTNIGIDKEKCLLCLEPLKAPSKAILEMSRCCKIGMHMTCVGNAFRAGFKGCSHCRHPNPF